MSRGMVAHDVMTSLHIHFGDRHIPNLWLTRNHFSKMNDHTRRGATHGGNFNFPRFVSTGAPLSANITSIIHLTAGFDIETGLRENDLNFIPKRGGPNRLTVYDESKHFVFDARARVGVIFNAVFAKF